MKMKWKFVLLFFSILFVIIFMTSFGSTGANDEEIHVDLVTKPANILFQIHNLKPGDMIKRTLIVENHGNIDVDYITNANFLAGSKKLYKQLKLWVTDNEQVLYEGSLSGFQGLDKRKLRLTKNDELHFYVEFPYESGNEFQGLTTEFEIVLAAEAKKSFGIFATSDSPTKLPKTGMTHPALHVVFGLGLFVIGIAWLYLRRLKRLIGDFFNL